MFTFVSFNPCVWQRGVGVRVRGRIILPAPQGKNYIYREIVTAKKLRKNQSFIIRSYERLKVISCKWFSVNAVLGGGTHEFK